MGLDDAVRRERAKAQASSDAAEADTSVVAHEIPIAQSRIREILRETLTHLPATHPSQVLRVVRVKGLTGTRFEVADHLWKLADDFLFGSDLSIYRTVDVPWKATALDYGLHRAVRKGVIRSDARFLRPDADTVDLSRKIAVRPGEATIRTPASDPPKYSLPRNIGLASAEHAFSVISNGSIYIEINDHGYDPSNDQYKLEDVCAQLIVKVAG